MAISNWVSIVFAVCIALAANTVSANWGRTPDLLHHLFNRWSLPMLLLAPLVFVTYGLVASRIGIANASAFIDTPLTVGSILIGLIAFQEWRTMSLPNYAGLVLAVIALVLLRYHPPPPPPSLF